MSMGQGNVLKDQDSQMDLGQISKKAAKKIPIKIPPKNVSNAVFISQKVKFRANI